MGEKILSWFERIVTGEKRRWFFAAVIVAIILGVIVFPYIDANFLYYLFIFPRLDLQKSILFLLLLQSSSSCGY